MAKKKSCVQKYVSKEMRKYHHGNLMFGKNKKHKVVSREQAAAIGYRMGSVKCNGGGRKRSKKSKTKK